MYTLIHSYGEASSDNLTQLLELAWVYFYCFKREVNLCGPRGWIWCDGRYVGDFADNGGYALT